MPDIWRKDPIILICPQESLRAKALCKGSFHLLPASCFSLGSSLPPKTEHNCKIGISKWAKIHYILFYLDCGIYVGYYDFWDLMWDKCGIVCQIIVCRKISTKMWDKCGIWEKVELKQIARNSLCGMNVGLVCVLPCWRCWVDVGFSLVPIIFIIFSAFYRT